MSHCGGFSCCRAQEKSAGASVVAVCGLSSCSSQALDRRLSRCGGLRCSLACGIFLDQGWNQCLLKWEAASLPLSHQESPQLNFCYLVFVSFYSLSREVQTCPKFFCRHPKHVTYKNASLWKKNICIWQKNLLIYPVPFCDPAIPLLGIYTEETRIERDIYTSVFISALFAIAKTWKQPRCPSADKWIRKLWYIYTMDYYSAIKKKNTFESVLMRWMKLESIIQNEVSHKEKHQYSILTYI